MNRNLADLGPHGRFRLTEVAPSEVARRKFLRFFGILSLLVAIAHPPRSLESAEGIRSVPLADKSVAKGESLFTALSADETGVDFTHPIDTSHPLKYLYNGGYAAGGIAIGDLDGDGRPDMLVSGGPVDNRLFLQTEVPFKFEDVTASIEGLAGANLWAAGVAFADIDNDRDLDIYISYFDSPNQLFINETAAPGRPKFVERSVEMGVGIVDASFMPHFCDYDNDGDLDFYLTAEQYRDPNGQPSEIPVDEINGEYVVREGFRKYYGVVNDFRGVKTFKDVGRSDHLFRNLRAESDGENETFFNITSFAGIRDYGNSNSAVWWDYDQDGLLDIFVANDFKHPDRLYRNLGNGQFMDVIENVFPHMTWFSMGSDAGDINNDGWLDLLVSDMAGTTHYRSKVTMGEMSASQDFLKLARPPQYMRNSVFVSSQTDQFYEAAYLTGLANTDWTWASKWVDLDNDGRLDAYFTNGSARMFNHADMTVSEAERVGKTEWDVWEDKPIRPEENLAFQNLGSLKFQEIGAKWGLRHKGMSYACAHGDLDMDGDLDLVVINLDEPMSIYRNDSSAENSMLVSLEGKRSNAYGIGATIRIRTSSGSQMRQLMPAKGFLASNQPIAHFGLGRNEVVEELSVEWPSGVEQRFSSLEAGRHYMVTESEAAEETEADAAPASNRSRRDRTHFSEVTFLQEARHQEIEFDDFERQPLSPNKYSQLGPGFAAGDLDADNRPDVYLGGAGGQAGVIYTADRRGNLSKAPVDVFEQDKRYEDMGSLFLDVEGDGDLDLFVVSGGVEFEPGDPLLEDRLYINEGSGRWSRASSAALPEYLESGSSVCAADYDRDGDLDLFVGGRVVPGRYPETPMSLLLENESQIGAPKFTDATDDVSSGLRRVGMVTGAIWTDANQDGWLDLMVATEWGAVNLFVNEGEGSNRRLINRTLESGLNSWLGWWNGVVSGDVDSDGDLDYLATNFGLNTKYKASVEKPELLFYGEFDESGRPHLVEAKYENGVLVPRRGLSCSSSAMPHIRQAFPTFHQFGIASLQEIYQPRQLDDSLRLEANTLETGFLINDGKNADGIPQFSFKALPRIAQIAPSFSASLGDVNGDGFMDLFLAQNFFGPQVETGRMDGGLSALFLGREPTGEEAIGFDWVSPADSGIAIRGDAMAAAWVQFSGKNAPDLLVSVNDGRWRAFLNRAGERFFVTVELNGSSGNPNAVGSQIVFSDQSGRVQVAEVSAGSGYLSQGSAPVAFGKGDNFNSGEIVIHWPNGAVSKHPVGERDSEIVASMPSR